MNVSQSADAELMESLKTQDPERYSRLMKNIRHDAPDTKMDEDQALTNFILGLPTGGFKFGVYKRPAILDGTLQNGSTEDCVAVILAVANSDRDNFQVIMSDAPVISTLRKIVPKPDSLVRRKYSTFEDRLKARRAHAASRQERARQRKTAPQIVA